MTSYERAIDAIVSRAVATSQAPESGFPHFADAATGRWTRTSDGDWTGGFFVGQLWLAQAIGIVPSSRIAHSWSEAIASRASSDSIFRGFLFWYGAALGDLLIHDERASEIASGGARALAASFSPTAGLIPLGGAAEEAHSVGVNETNIDGVPGVAPLLYWAAERTGDTTLRDIARSHVSRHLDLLVRDDGSVVQSATFDLESGELIKTYTHKGVTDDSTWTRAQAWAMLGAAQASWYEPDLFVAKARKVCDWWCDHVPPGSVAYWDFDAPVCAAAPLLDTSGTAIAAAALLKLARLVDVGGARYEAVARQMVNALVTRHLSLDQDSARPPGILGDGCYNHRIGLATRHELVWGTYFLLESLMMLDGRIDTVSL